MKELFLFIGLLLIALPCCDIDLKPKTRRETIFIGIDVSGSFSRTAEFKNSLKFLSYYIYGHLKGLGGLARPKDLYVGGIGGDQKEDPQTFFPIHDFQDLKPQQIEKKLRREFSHQKDALTDFNTFFQRVAMLVKQKNLVLAPIKLIVISDGVPEILRGKTGKIRYQAYSKIKLGPLEYLSRNVSVRLLYASPKVGNEWVRYVPKNRVKVWSVEAKVMNGWKHQLKRGNTYLWSWMKDNIDRKIYRSGQKKPAG